jgi:hypothetical protein
LTGGRHWIERRSHFTTSSSQKFPKGTCFS